MIIGIDLGTTNSLVATWRNGSAQLIPNGMKQVLTPSVVGLDDNGVVLVGQPAVERMLTHPQLTTSVFKRYMGTNRSVTLGGRSFRPEELSSLVLRSLKRDAEVWAEEPVTEAVISVPAYFNDAQRKATKTAGELAGLRVERLINEPTAAALAYGLQHAKPETQFLVFDLGGGTFDITILELFEGIMEVRASAGDNFLGGEDFVAVIADRFVDKVGQTIGVGKEDLLENPRLYQAIRREAELSKRRLTETTDVTMTLRWNGSNAEFPITQADLAEWAEPLLARIRFPVERALRDAKIRPSALSEILLVGGATRMPLIRSLVARMFGRFPSTEIHPDEAVAIGTAVQAGLKARDAALNEVVLTDVCPYSLGIEVAQESSSNRIQPGFFAPIIERNTVIPCSRVETFNTVQNRQQSINVRIFQGEGRMVKDNIELGSIDLKVPPKPKGEETIDVRFTYDINGLLEIEGKVNSTGLQKTIVIEGTSGAMNPEEIRARLHELAKLKIHPFELTENRALMAKADRLYEQSLGATREVVGVRTAAFSEVMAGQNPRDIAKARREFSTFLDEIEKGSQFNPELK